MVDMRQMLQPIVVEHVVDPFRVTGVFDLDIDIEQLPGMPEKFLLEARFTDATATFAGHLDPETRRRFGFAHLPSRACALAGADAPSARAAADMLKMNRFMGA